MHIPFYMHLFWMGRALGRQELACLRTIRFHHPHWQIIVHAKEYSPHWKPPAQHAELRVLDWLDSEARELLGLCRGAAMCSDVVRYFVLRRWGGVWIDFDVVCLRPFDKLCQAPGFVGSESFGVIGSSVIGASVESPVICRALQLLPAWLKPEDHLCIGPRLLTRAVLDCGANWQILQPESFYPWRWSQVGRPPSRESFSESLAVHLYSSFGQKDASAWRLLTEMAPELGKAEDDT